MKSILAQFWHRKSQIKGSDDNGDEKEEEKEEGGGGLVQGSLILEICAVFYSPCYPTWSRRHRKAEGYSRQRITWVTAQAGSLEPGLFLGYTLIWGFSKLRQNKEG